MLNPSVSTLLHLAELVVVALLVGVLALLAKHYFDIDATSYVKYVLFLVLAGLAKFARASDAPVPDYVNGPIAQEKQK